MALKVKINKGNLINIIAAAALMSFCILKVLRGADVNSTKQGGIWNYISLIFYVLLAFLCIQYRRFKVKTIFLVAFIYVLFAYISCIGTDSIILQKDRLYTLIMISYPFVVFSVFYLSSNDNTIFKRLILVAYYVCLAVNLVTIIMHQFQMSSRAMASDIYFSLCLFPFSLLFIKNKVVLACTVIAQFMGSFLADKRAGFLAFAVGFIAYVLLFSALSGKKSVIKSLKIIAISLALAFILLQISRMLDNRYQLKIYERIFRLREDGGSGRSKIYTAIWSNFADSSFVKKVFGHGVGSIETIANTRMGHNDFMDALYSYGLISAVALVCFYVCLIAELIRLCKQKSQYAPAFAFSIVIGLSLSMFSSLLVYYTYVAGIVAFWGYIYAMAGQDHA